MLVSLDCITKCHRLRGFNRNLFLRVLKSGKFKIKVSADLTWLLARAPFPAYRWLWLCVSTSSLQCVHACAESSLVFLLLLRRALIPSDHGYSYTSFNLNYFHKGSFSKNSQLGGHCLVHNTSRSCQPSILLQTKNTRIMNTDSTIKIIFVRQIFFARHHFVPWEGRGDGRMEGWKKDGRMEKSGEEGVKDPAFTKARSSRLQETMNKQLSKKITNKWGWEGSWERWSIRTAWTIMAPLKKWFYIQTWRGGNQWGFYRVSQGQSIDRANAWTSGSKQGPCEEKL